MNEQQIPQMYNRYPPQAAELEQAVLSAMMMESEYMYIGTDKLAIKDFYVPAHAHIFEAILDLAEQKIRPDRLSVEQWIRDNGLADKVSRAVYSDIDMAFSANVEYNIQILKEKSMLRQIIVRNAKSTKLAYEHSADPYDILDLQAEDTRNIEKEGTIKVPKSSSMAMSEVLKQTVEELNVRDGMVGIPAYLPIDTLTAGFPSKELIYIAARPSMGKTGYMLTVVRNQLLKSYDKPLVIFSYEMDEYILLLRLACMIAKVNMNFARRGKLNDAEKERLVEAAHYIGIEAVWNHKKKKLEVSSVNDSIIFIVDDNETDAEAMQTKIRSIEREHGQIGMILVDYLQLMPVKNAKNKNIHTREQEVAHCSRRMKAQAKEFDCPYIVLSQLSRSVENRKGDNRPILSDLRESGSIEQDATMVMFLYRPEYYDILRTEEGVSTKGLCEVILRKNRNGPVGTTNHHFQKEYALFEEWDQDDALRDDLTSDPRVRQQWVAGRDDPGETPGDIDDDMPF